MRRRVLKLLEDVRHSAAQIQSYAAGKSEAQYLSDSMLRDAIERRFEIVGEALRRLKSEAPDIASKVPNLETIIGFRNVLAHQYDDTRDATVWQTARNDVPVLLGIILALMEEESAIR